MNKTSFAPLTAALALSLALPAALAQTSAAKPAAKPAAKAPAKTTSTKAKTVAKAAPAAAVPLAAASEEQKSAAASTHIGDYACEFGQTVKVSHNTNNPGYVDVGFKGQTWTAKPVLSSTGALRLEDVKNRMLMLQIANKSMIMDTQVGQRVVDGCQHERQREFAKTMQPQEGSMLGK